MENECKLCGYPYKEKGHACKVCGAMEFKHWKLTLGYMYPAEAEEVKKLINRLLLLILIIVGGTITIVGWLMMSTSIINGM